MQRALNNLVSLSNNPIFRKDAVEESFKELGLKIEMGAYYEEGRIESKIKAIKKILAKRFGSIPSEFELKLEKLNDVDLLEKILDMSLEVCHLSDICLE